MSTLKLTEPMRRTLRSAPEDWQKIGHHSASFPSIEALEKRGLVGVRFDPTVPNKLGSLQWCITATGRVMDARVAAPMQPAPMFTETGS